VTDRVIMKRTTAETLAGSALCVSARCGLVGCSGWHWGTSMLANHRFQFGFLLGSLIPLAALCFLGHSERVSPLCLGLG
jgi:hypothetical protein